jgi:hypothetical protein
MFFLHQRKILRDHRARPAPAAHITRAARAQEHQRSRNSGGIALGVSFIRIRRKIFVLRGTFT